MPNLSEISNGTKLIVGAGVLLLIAMFLPWQDFGNEITEAVGVDASFSGWRGIGILMGLVLLALLAWVLLQVFKVNLSFELPVTDAWLTLGLGIAVLALAVIKLLTIIDDEATIWSYIGVILAALVAIGAWLRAQELGGIGQRTAMADAGGTTMAGDEGMGMGDRPMTREGDTGMTAQPTMPPPMEPAPPAAPAEPAEPMEPRRPMDEPMGEPGERMGEPRMDDEEPPPGRAPGA